MRNNERCRRNLGGCLIYMVYSTLSGSVQTSSVPVQWECGLISVPLHQVCFHDEPNHWSSPRFPYNLCVNVTALGQNSLTHNTPDFPVVHVSHVSTSPYGHSGVGNAWLTMQLKKINIQ